MMEIFIIYNKTTGRITGTGKVDRSDESESSMYGLIQRKLAVDINKDALYLPSQSLPDPETFKVDPITEQLIDNTVAVEYNKTVYQEYDEAMCGNVPCVVGDKTYLMQAGEEHAERLQNGIKVSELLGETETFIIEADNTVNTGVSLTDAYEILKQVGKFNRDAHMKRASERII